MDQQALDFRAEIARKLKAARWIAGDVEASATGKSGYAVRALETADLAKREPLPANKITASMLGSIERMERHTTPMELEQIARALNLPRDYFGPAGALPSDPLAALELLAPELLAAAQEIRQAREAERSDERASGRQQATRGASDGEGRTRRS